MQIKIWLQAFRLRTLPLALSCIAMGGFLAANAESFQVDIFLLCITTTILLQILSNLANDYGDSVHGADSDARPGPKRAVQSGQIRPGEMKRALIVFIILCLASGISLLRVAFGGNWNALLFFLGLGVCCILAAIAYTVGNRPYGYLGLGDLSVLIFFGLVGVLGSTYLFTKEVAWVDVLPALSCGLFSIAVLNINNLRDMISDRLAGKYSIPVRVGRAKAIVYHWLLLIGGVLSSLTYTLLTFRSGWQFLFLLTVPILFRIGNSVARKAPHQLDPYLRQMAMTTLLFVLLFGVGLIL